MSAGRKRRQPEQAQDLILDAAEHEFLSRGYEGFRVADVARGAGVSRPLVVHYFGSRDDLLEAVVQRVLARLGASVLEEVKNHAETGTSSKLPQTLMAATHAVFKKHARLIVWLMLSGRANKLVEPIKAVIAAIHESRVSDVGDASIQDTSFVVAMQLFALLASEIAPEMLGLITPKLGGKKRAGFQFREWLAEIAGAHLERRVSDVFEP